MDNAAQDITKNGPPDLMTYRHELVAAADELIKAGLPVTVAEGKNPGLAMGTGWQAQTLDAQAVFKITGAVSHPTLGAKVGPGGGIIDADVDSASEERALVALFDGDPPAMPTYTSGRDGGKHCWLLFDERLQAIGKATVTYVSAAGDEVTLRIGCGDKGAHSVCPPSYHATDKDPVTNKGTGAWRWTGPRYTWLPGESIDDIDPPPLPDRVVEKLIAAAQGTAKKTRTTTTMSAPIPPRASSGEVTGAVAAMVTSTKSMEDGGDGSKRLFVCACRAVELNLNDIDAIAAVKLYAVERPFPAAWTDDDILQRVRDAEKTVARGSELVFSNAIEYETGELDEDGEPEVKRALLKMADIRADLDAATDRWPRRVCSGLFIHDPVHGIGWLAKPDALFGWLHTRRVVKWFGGPQAVTRQNLHAELERTAIAYDAVEGQPHFPPMARHYYTCTQPKPGNGDALRRLVARFTPSTTVDRDLLLALFVTPFWGGLPGQRPAFVLTSDAGRGAGKTTACEIAGHLAGGLMTVEPSQKIDKLMDRLLSPGADGKRVCLVDNVKTTKFSWAELEALITTPVISGKRMFVGEWQRPNTLTWCVTINGVNLSTDLAQRSIIIKLDKANYSGSWKDETYAFIDSNRDALLADIAAFFEGDRWQFGKASRWGAWERDVLSRLPEPGDAQALILERQAECDADGDDGAMIDDHFAERLRELGYCPDTIQVRIPVKTVAFWFNEANGEPMRTAAVTGRIKQMSTEGQVKRLSIDKSNRHGRSFIYTGPAADILNSPIHNDLNARVSEWLQSRNNRR
jgi:hypothetical protein